MDSGRDTSPPLSPGGVLLTVEPDSPADRGGLRPGQRVLAVEGAPILDVIDWQWYASDATAALTIAEPDGSVRDVLISREYGEGWGVSFEEALFDGVRTCRNRCSFCFMTQLPPGLRPSLYLRDDDYRLSFLSGNFVTFTNLTDEDVARIVEQHLSPLFVSLHAVDPDVRERLICPGEIDTTLERFDELLAERTRFHVQIVLVPGVNDAQQLERTLDWLEQREGVISVGIVPLGYTRHQPLFDSSFEDAAASAAVIDQVRPRQEASRARRGSTWVQLADEFYLNAGRDLPPSTEYDEYPQYENGVGMVRDFIDAWNELLADMSPETGPQATLLTGTLFAPVLRDAISRLPGSDAVRVLEVPNSFFGGNVSVTGLIAGSDILSALDAASVSSPVLLPSVVFNSDGLTLDDMTLAQLRETSGVDLRLVGCDAASLGEALGLTSPNPRRE